MTATPDGGPLTLERIRRDVAELLADDLPLADEENLLDRGLDSIRMMTLVERWSGAGAEVTFPDLAEHPTIAGWWELLKKE